MLRGVKGFLSAFVRSHAAVTGTVGSEQPNKYAGICWDTRQESCPWMEARK
jgi:hypothetical protein